jgi:hypothetical protein
LSIRGSLHIDPWNGMLVLMKMEAYLHTSWKCSFHMYNPAKEQAKR